LKWGKVVRVVSVLSVKVDDRPRPVRAEVRDPHDPADGESVRPDGGHAQDGAHAERDEQRAMK
jgi:hypothetical protein